MGTLFTVDGTTGNITTAGSITTSGAPVLPAHTFLASGGTITPNATITSTVFVTVDAVATIHGPTGGYNGQKILFKLSQDSTGHSVTFSTGTGNFQFIPSTSSFTASGANKVDFVGAIYDSVANLWDIVSISTEDGNSGITALTGDVTATGPGSAAATLATVNSNVGSFTTATITVNAKGLITAASSGTSFNVNTILTSSSTGQVLVNSNGNVLVA
jgi:hypothetical protein